MLLFQHLDVTFAIRAKTNESNLRTMAAGDLPTLSRRERELMDILYQLGSASAVQIQELMAHPPSYSAVRSILRVLVEKRHLNRESDGTRYVYSPALPVHRAQRSAIRQVLRTFFGGSVEGAVTMLLEIGEGDLTPAERARIKAMIDEAEEDGR